MQNGQIETNNIVEALTAMGQQISYNNQLLLNNVQAINHRFEQQNRKRRRKKIAEMLIASPSSVLCMNRIYDDESMENLCLTRTLTGKFKIFVLDFHGREQTPKFGIFFENEKIWVIGNKKDISPEYFWKCFTKAIGPLNPAIPRSTAGKVLYDFFAAQVEQAEERKNVPVLAGWYEDNFFHHDNFMFKANSTFPDLPVLKKTFPTVLMTKEVIEIYVMEMKKIFNTENRAIVALYPFLGILSSVYSSFDFPVDFCINFIEMGDVYRKRICSWLKVFDRESLLPYSLDVKDADLENLIMDTNDEVLMCDATWNEFDSDYKKNKIRKNALRIINAMKKNGSFVNSKQYDSCFSTVFFSQEKILENGVFNIYLDKKFCSDKDANSLLFLEKKVMESILSTFVKFVKNNLESVWEKIVCKRTEDSEKQIMINSIFDIYCCFWREKGVDIQQALELGEEIEWNKIVGDHIYDEDEIIKEFIRAVRKNISKFYVIEKRRMAQYYSDAVYFSEEYIWIPTKIFALILDTEKILHYGNDILLALKRKEAIYTDSSGYARKTIISKIQFESYQIKISIFDECGKIPILDMAKEA